MHLILGQFVSWGMAGAAMAAGTIPILIHLLNRQRFKRVVWAAMDFLLAASRKNARRIKLEHWLLLAIRTLAILLAGLAIARPYLPSSASTALIGRPSTIHLIVLDGSLSMQQPGPNGSPTAWQSAVVQAEKLLDSLPPTDRVGLLVADQPIRAQTGSPTLNHDDIRRQLKGQACGYGRPGWSEVFQEINKNLDESKALNRQVYVFTDLSGADFRADAGGSAGLTDGIRSLGQKARLTVVDLGGTNTQNAALLDLALVSPLAAVGVPADVRISVKNFGRRELAGLTIKLRRDDQYVASLAVPALPEGAVQTLQARVVFDKPGAVRLEAVLNGLANDAILADNHRYLTVNVRDKVHVLLVDGQPASRPMAGATGYLRVALAPRAEANQPTLIEPKTITDLELPAEDFSRYAAVYLANVRQLEPRDWQRLGDYVRAGGAVVLFMGNQVSIDHYNRLAYAEGQGVLPLRLDRLLEADNTNTGGVGYWTFQLADANSPIVEDFGQHRAGGLFTARVMRFIKTMGTTSQPAGVAGAPAKTDGTRTNPTGTEAKGIGGSAGRRTQNAAADGTAVTVLALSDGAPALVVRALGRGQTALFTTAANLGTGDQLWTNLPAKMDWVVLQQNLLANLLPREGAERNFVVGEPIRLPLPARDAVTPLVTGPEETRPTVRLVSETLPEAGRPAAPAGSQPAGPGGNHPARAELSAVVNDTRLPGFYRFDLRPQDVWFAANVDTEGSDLTHASEAELRTSWGAGVKIVQGVQAETLKMQENPTREIGLTLLTIALALLLVETFLAQRFGHHAG